MYCTKCGNEFMSGYRFCKSCGAQHAHRGKPIGQIEDELHYVLPVGVPGTALLAGYLGLFSVLIVPAPFALILGFIGLHQMKKGTHKYGKLRCWTGIIMGGVFTLLLAWLLIMAII